MKSIKWWVEMSKQGCDQNGEFEVEDDASDEEIEEQVREEVFNYVQWGWS